MSSGFNSGALSQARETENFYVNIAPSEGAKPDGRSVAVSPTEDATVMRVPVFQFALRGLALNPIIDCASPMIALILRISGLGHFDDIEDLYKRCKHEIEAVELELHKLGYDRTTILTFRYCLCSIVDEVVMVSPWGMNSKWSEYSLLAIYHQETWGGEKFFVIVERLMMEPQRYLDIIEFLYLCMVLGYEGKYRPQHNGRLNLEAFMKEVHDVIRKERGYPEALSTFHNENITPKDHLVTWQTPVTTVAIMAAIVAMVIYFGFFLYTEGYTNGIIDELARVLNG